MLFCAVLCDCGGGDGGVVVCYVEGGVVRNGVVMW